MARIRTIKPEFWSDEKMSALPPIDRLVFLGIISLADDYGRVHDVEKVIDAFIFPNTDDNVRESLANLSRMGRIRRGRSSSGKPILEIVNWGKHQRVDHPQPKMALPPIDDSTNENVDSTTIRESLANDSGTVREPLAPLTTDHRPPTNDLQKSASLSVPESVSESPKPEKQEGSNGEALEKTGWSMPEGVDPDHWRDWMLHRKKKNSSNTPTAWKKIEREATNAGLSIASVVQICAERSWAGFESAWVEDASKATPRSKATTSEPKRQKTVYPRPAPARSA
jgi:hypothetical protein